MSRHSHRALLGRRAWLAAAVIAAALAATPFAAGADPSAPGAASLEPSSGVLLGAYAKKRAEASHYDAVLALEAKLGRKLAVDHHFHKWPETYWKVEQLDIAAGRVPLISWPGGRWPAGVNAQSILSGSQDATIRSVADALRALGKPVFLRFAFNMDDRPGGPRYIGEPTEVIAAWRRVHRMFEARGATNVTWVWCAIGSNFAKGRAQSYYPGDAYVDWIGTDDFSFWPKRFTSAGTWRSFQQMFSAFYAWAAPRGKPLMIAATGAQEDPVDPQRKARWIAEAGQTMKTTMPRIKAFVYWHADHATPEGDAQFWIDTSSASLTAFRTLGFDPFFSPRLP